MKKQLIRVLALTLAPLFLACGALASDVPTCPLISWDEYVASSGGWAAAGAYDASSCGASAASGSAGFFLVWRLQLGPAFERDVRFMLCGAGRRKE